MSKNFSDLGVPENICKALKEQGIQQPFEIQEKTIQEGLEGSDICGRAPTGSGKTLAFGIPLVAKTNTSKSRKPESLILAPTRELAEQICNELRSFSGRVNVFVVYGGVGYGPQKKALAKGVDILVACPGRLEDLIEQGEVNLGSIKQVVIDEADRMADMGFMPAISRILDQTPKDRQTILFSATLDKEVAQLKKRYQRNPILHEVGERNPDIKRAKHTYTIAKKSDKAEIAADAVKATWPAIIFCKTRHGSDRLAKQLKKLEVDAESIHGGKSQHQRRRALKNFSTGRAQTLVATDVAARGIHVDGVELVIHYDLPEDHKAYIHRSGRTARAGNEGIVFSIIQPEQKKTAIKMQKRLGLFEVIERVDPNDLSEFSSGQHRGKKERTQRKSENSQQPKSQKKVTHEKSAKPKKPRQQSPKNRKGSQQKPRNKNQKNRNAENSKKNQTNKHSNQKSKSSKTKKNVSPTSNNRPNRKARRAHLQPTNR